MSKAIYGIDLGTTFTKCALAESDGHVQVFSLDVDAVDRKTPVNGLKSVVLVKGEASRKQALVGNLAAYERDRKYAGKPPMKFFEEAKLWIGADATPLTGEEPPWDFEPHGWPYRPEDVGALVLKKVKQQVERAGDYSLTSAVITHPQYFSSVRREATRHAAAISRIEVVDLLTEPDAAAIAYGKELQDGRYMVFDLGGGTLDIVILSLDKRNATYAKAETSEGNMLAGRDFDRKVFDWLVQSYATQTNEMFNQGCLTDRAKAEWLAHAERIKRVLNTEGVGRTERVPFVIPFDSDEAKAEGRLEDSLPPCKVEMSLEEFEEQTSDLVDACGNLAQRALANRKLQWKDLQGVLLVGGSTKLKAVQRKLRELSDDLRLIASIDPDLVVAHGAAIHALQLSRRGMSSPPPAPGRAAPVTVQRSSYAGVLSRTLGVLAMNKSGVEIVVPLIPKDTAVPLEKPVEKVFYTLEANQEELEVKFLEGEEQEPEQCDPVGTVLLKELPPGPARTKVVVRLGIDANGTKHVFVKVGAREVEEAITYDPSRVLDRRAVQESRRFVDTVIVT
jgi:molecular chaperone DnaK (HSP70)